MQLKITSKLVFKFQQKISTSLLWSHMALKTDLSMVNVNSCISVMPTFYFIGCRCTFTFFINKLDFFLVSDLALVKVDTSGPDSHLWNQAYLEDLDLHMSLANL